MIINTNIAQQKLGVGKMAEGGVNSLSQASLKEGKGEKTLNFLPYWGGEKRKRRQCVVG